MTGTLSWQDLRVLGAIELRDGVVRRPVDELLTVTGDGLTINRNRSGLFVLMRARGFTAFTTAFDAQPADPRPLEDDTFTVAVNDPTRRWLPRLVTVVLPRDPTALPPSERQQPGSLFRPIAVELLPSPAAPVSAWWAVLRVRVERLVAGQRVGVRGALLRLRAAPDVAPHDGVADAPPAADAPVLAYGLSDQRGEALLAVAALPAHTFVATVTDDSSAADDDGDPATTHAPVLTPDTPCVLDAVVDPAAPWPFDHDTLRTRFADAALPRASLALAVRAGSQLTRTLLLTP